MPIAAEMRSAPRELYRAHPAARLTCYSALRRFMLGIVVSVPLAGCVSHLPPVPDSHVVMVSGRGTAGYDQKNATRMAIVVAARVTVDHGFRYFRVVGSSGANDAGGLASLQPGVNFAIRVYDEGETNPHGANLFDAQAVLVEGPPNVAYEPRPPVHKPQPAASATPRCTAYGCDWR